MDEAAFQAMLDRFAEPIPILLDLGVEPKKIGEIDTSAPRTWDTNIAVSEKGERVAWCTSTGGCWAWDAQTGRTVELQGEIEGAPLSWTLALTPDGKHGLIGGGSEAVHVWDTATGKIVFTHEAPQATVTHVRTSRDGKWMVCAAQDGSIFRFPLLGGFGNALQMPQALPKYSFFAAAEDGESALAGYSNGQAALFLFPKPNTPVTPEQLRQSILGLRTPVDLVTFAGSHGPYFLLSGHSRRGTALLKHTRQGGQSDLQFRKSSDSPHATSDMVMTPDERLVLSSGAGDVLEVRAADVLPAMTRLSLNLDELQGGVTRRDLSPDGRFLAGVQRGEILLFELPDADEYPLVSMADFGTTVRAALRGGDRALLKRLSAAYADDAVPFVWSRGVAKHHMLLEFLTGESLIHDEPGAAAERLEAWHKEEPEAMLPRLALAHHYQQEAWDARGRGFAGEVTEEGWQAFHELMAKSWGLLEEIEPAEDVPADFYRLVFGLAKAEGWERARWEEFQQALMEHAPQYYPAHEVVVELLLPRWGGEPGESEAYAREVADAVKGPDGDALYARLAMRLGRYAVPDLSERELYKEHYGLDLERVRRGLEHLFAQSPKDEYLAADRAYVMWLLEDGPAIAKALSAYDRLVFHPEHNWPKRASFVELNTFNRRNRRK